MNHRSKTTGQFSRPLFELYLHDLGNLACQFIEISEDKLCLERIANSMNQAFMLAGQDKSWLAQVVESEETKNASTKL